MKLLTCLLITLSLVYLSNEFIRIRIRLPRIRLPRVRLPRIRLPRIRLPRVRVRSIIRSIGSGFEAIGDKIKHGFDILTKGCCGLYPSYCKKRKEFENRQKDIKKKSQQMDKDWVVLKKKMAQMKTININNQEVFRQVRRVTLASTLTVQTLDPQILDRINNVTNELKKALREKNATVLNYGINDIGKEIEKTEGKAKTELLDATGIGGFSQAKGLTKMTADMFRLVKLDGVANFLEGDVLNYLHKAKVGISKLFGFHHLEKLAKNNKALGVVLGALKFYQNYLNVFGAVFKVFELFGKFTAWITDLATCKKRKDEMNKSIVELRKDHEKIKASYKKMPGIKKTTDSNLRTVVNEARSSGLLTNLIEVQKIASHSSSNSAEMKRSITAIRNYRLKVKRSNYDGIIKLQQALIYAVGNITYTAECYQRKLATFKTVSENCRLGKASLKDLYNQALSDFRTNSDECKDESGLPYTTFADVEKFVKTKAKKLNFELECLLNSGVKLAVVCNELRYGYTLREAASTANVNQTLAKVYQDSCPMTQLSPLAKSYICKWKKYRKMSEIKSSFRYATKNEFETVYNSCNV